MFTASSSKNLGLLLALLFEGYLFGLSSASPTTRQLEQDALNQATSDANFQRNLQQFVVDFTPDADPDFVCTEYQKATNGTYECKCNVTADKSVALECIETSESCNADDSICFFQTVKIGLNLENQIDELETCTTYVDLNLTRFDESSTKIANYSQITPCVKVEPVAPNDFSALTACTATVNGNPCWKCEICNDNAPILGINVDCCNTNPNGEPLKVTCGPVGGGGAFAPIFDTYQEGQEGTCESGATDAFRRSHMFMWSLSVVATISLGLLF